MKNTLHKNLTKLINITLNEKMVIELSVKDDNPLVASLIAKNVNEILQKKIIDFKLKNLNDTYKFIIEQLNAAKDNFYKLQDSLAIFSDKNKTLNPIYF